MAKLNYNHKLTSVHRKNGYTLALHTNDHDMVWIQLKHKGKPVGDVNFRVHGKAGQMTSVNPWAASLDEQHRGKGLGFRMYDAGLEYAKKLGVKEVRGGPHSEDAHRVHQKLAQKYGVEYTYKTLARPSTVPIATTDGVGYVKQPYGRYSYPLGKAEVAW